MHSLDKYQLAALLPEAHLSKRVAGRNDMETSFIQVPKSACRRYGFQLPVLISLPAYQRCVAVRPSTDTDAKAREALKMLKVLALTKYAIVQAPARATVTEFKLALNTKKFNNLVETLRSQVVVNQECLPMLLIQLASEVATEVAPLASVPSTMASSCPIQEAV